MKKNKSSEKGGKADFPDIKKNREENTDRKPEENN